MAATPEDAHRTLREQGRKVMTEVLGAPYVARRDDSTSDFKAPIRRLSEEFAYASLWTRERESGQSCGIHLTGGINNGCSAEEIRELFTHSVAYCGFPAAIDALRVAEEVLREKGLLGTD